jgi:aldehyde:ferredoxin oxidoreductase
MGVALSVADFASHTRLWCTEQEMASAFAIDDIPVTIADGLDTVNVRNSLIICDFVPLGLNRLASLLNAATGLDYSADDLLALGTKLTHLARRYNLRNGRKYTDDIMPERFFSEKSLAGFMRDKYVDKDFFNDIIQKYYKVRGWTPHGEPTNEILKKYSLV